MVPSSVPTGMMNVRACAWRLASTLVVAITTLLGSSWSASTESGENSVLTTLNQSAGKVRPDGSSQTSDALCVGLSLTGNNYF